MHLLLKHFDARQITTMSLKTTGYQNQRIRSEPSLDPQQPQTLLKLRKEESDILGNYGWTDKEAGIARIPIERAMKLIVEQGLPTAESKKGGKP